MTKWDVKNYLEKIYKIPVVKVNTIVKCGDIKKAKGKNYLIKEDDYKTAIVDLVFKCNIVCSLAKYIDFQPKDVKFEFPDLFPKDKVDQTSKDLKGVQKEMDFGQLRETRKNYKNKRHNVPDWFGI